MPSRNYWQTRRTSFHHRYWRSFAVSIGCLHAVLHKRPRCPHLCRYLGVLSRA
nr:hypothetical protein [Alienimonas californiensis]